MTTKPSNGSRLYKQKEIYTRCDCCNFYYLQKYVSKHKITPNVPRVTTNQWFGNIVKNNTDIKFEKINDAYIDPDSFTIAKFQKGQLVQLNLKNQTLFVNLYPSKFSHLSELTLHNDFFISNHLNNNEFANVTNSVDIPTAKTVIVSVDCRKTIDHLDQLICSKLNGLVVAKDQNLTISLDSYKLIIKVVDIKDFNDSTIDSLDFSKLSLQDKSVAKSQEYYVIDVLKTTIKVETDIKYCSLYDHFYENPNFVEFGGYAIEEHVDILKNVAYHPIKHSDRFKLIGSTPPNGCLLSGLPGAGKSSVVYKFCQLYSFSLAVFEIEEFINASPDFFDSFEKLLKTMAPQLILIKHIDRLTTKDGSRNEEKVVTDKIYSIIKKNPSFFVFTCYNSSNLPIFFNSSDFAIIQREIPSLNDSQRLKIVLVLLGGIKNSLTEKHASEIAEKTKGFTPRDLVMLFKCAVLQAINRVDKENSLLMVNRIDFDAPLLENNPEIIRELEIFVPETSWDDIGGMGHVKSLVQECIEWPYKYPEAFQMMNISPPSGVLLYGPPGCSKTMIARAIAHESNLNFISVRGPEFVSMYVGESERAIRKLFSKARSASPCVIFFDEIDSLCVKSNNHTSDSGRIIAQLLTEIDGISSQRGKVFVVAATNKPFDLQPALIRTGRFDRLVYVPLPNVSERECIFKLKLNKMSVDKSVTAATLAEMTDNYSGAEIVAVCREAALASLRENIENRVVFKRHFDQVLSTFKPRTQSDLIEMYQAFCDQHGRIN